MILLGPKYIVCDALCGAWKHQCKLMGILFSITSVLCLLFAIAILYSLQFNFRGKSCVDIALLLLHSRLHVQSFLFRVSFYRNKKILANFCAAVYVKQIQRIRLRFPVLFCIKNVFSLRTSFFN